MARRNGIKVFWGDRPVVRSVDAAWILRRRGVSGRGLKLSRTRFESTEFWEGFGLGKIELNYVGMFFGAFEDDVATVWGNVEVANVEAGGQVGQLRFGARFEIDAP